MRRLGFAFLLVALVVPAPARALFHQSDIAEIMSGFGGDPNVQYVEIRLQIPGQNKVAHTRLTVFDCTGTTYTVLIDNMPHDVTNQGANARWLMGTEAFASAACLQPDFYFPPGIASCGMVCWGAPPQANFLPPANPVSWDASVKTNYIDCVSFGSYTGTNPFSNSPSPSMPGDGTQSLSRIGNTGADADDFTLADPTPTNNANLTSAFSNPCPSTTTTTSTTLPRSASTTTTLPGAGVDARLSGKRLVLKDNPNNPAKRSLLVVSSDAGISLGAGNGSADDPTGSTGGAVRVRTAAGCGTDGTLPCDVTFTLPARLWSKLGKGANKGYRLRDPRGTTSSIRVVILKSGRGRILRVTGKGATLPPLTSNPVAVEIVVTTGAKHYCLRFDAVTRFKAGRAFIASGAAPGACP